MGEIFQAKGNRCMKSPKIKATEFSQYKKAKVDDMQRIQQSKAD